MAFPTIPTVAAGRILSVASTAGGATNTFPSLTGLTKNAGDLLIAIIVIYDGNSTNAEFSSWGGGFTEFVDQATTTTMGIGVAYKWSTGSETGTFTVTTADSSTTDRQMILLSIPGAHASTPPEGGTIANGTSAAADPGSFAPSWGAADTLWISIAGSGETSTTGSFTGLGADPADYTDPFETGISADVVGGVEAGVSFRQLNAASEDVGAWSVDTSNARNSALLIAVLSPPPPTEGAATGTVTWAGSAAGTTVRSGAGSGSIAWVGTADGEAPVSVQEGAGIGAVAWAGTATGSVGHTGNATGSVTWSGTADGTAVQGGAASGSIGWVGAADGATLHAGAGIGSVTWTGAATGEAPTEGVREGSGAGTVVWSGTATGTTVREGAATGTVGWAGTSAGTSTHAGLSTGSVTWAGSATGEAPTVGDQEGFASGTITWTGNATGFTNHEGTAVGMIAWVGSSYGGVETFWAPDPVAYAVAPVAYTPVGPNDPPL